MKENRCTFSPDGLFGYSWSDACKIHDEDYASQTISRKEADIKLRENMKKKLPIYLHFIPWVYYLFVRIFGKYAIIKSYGGENETKDK